MKVDSGRVMPRRQTVLPTRVSSFVGRQRELAEVNRLLGTSRLVTLVGSGGVGKTRLALQVAAALEDGGEAVLLAELASLADPALVPQAVALAIGIREQARKPIMQTLQEALRFRHVLVLLDNCEHLAQACAELAEGLLESCPDLRILATSRQSLGASGEVTWRVPSLAVPDAAADRTNEQVLPFAATQLFIERATAARPDFRLTSDNATAVGEVCRRLDGIPLALELAATRVRLLSVEQLAERLDHRFQLLSVGERTAPSRQRTLRATLDWSFALLGDAERSLFARLSVFAGGWTLDAAEAICAADGVESNDVLDALGRLVDQSLVVADHRGSKVRYRLLETMREYAAEKLADSGASTLIEERHRNWFLAQAESSQLYFHDPAHVARLADELDNLRAAMRWSLERGDVDAALRLAIAVSTFWHQRGAYTEGRTWFDEMLRLPDNAARDPTRAMGFVRAATLAQLQSDLAQARALIEKALAIATPLGDSSILAAAALARGVIARRQGDLRLAETCAEQCRLLSHEYGHAALEFYGLLNLGMIALDRGDPSAEQFGIASLELAQRIGHVRGMPSALQVLGRVAANQGRTADARSLLEESLRLFRKNVDRDGEEVTLRALADYLLDQGDAGGACALLAESLAMARQGGDLLEMARALESLVGIAVSTDPRRAVQLAAAAAALRDSIHAVPFPTDRTRLERWLEAARRRLGEAMYEANWRVASNLTAEQAVALGLEEANLSTHELSGPLSAREQEVALLVARGYTNREIAEQLVIAPRTADTHVGHILAKLDLRSRAELAAWAVAHGLAPAHT